MHPISGAPAQPPGEGRNPLSAASEQPLSMQQRTVLERLITRLISLTQQQSAEVWAGIKHDLGIKMTRRYCRATSPPLNRILPSVWA